MGGRCEGICYGGGLGMVRGEGVSRGRHLCLPYIGVGRWVGGDLDKAGDKIMGCCVRYNRRKMWV